MEDLEKKVVKSVFWVGLARLGGQVLSWSVTILLIRILSPQDYGLMGMAIAYKAFVTIFFDMSIGEAVLQKKDLSEKDINTAFWICLSFAVLLYGITWFAAIAWAKFFSSNELVKIVRVLGGTLIILSIKEIPNRLLARKFEFKKRSFFELIAGIICILTSLVMALKGFGVWSLIAGELVRDFFLTCFIVGYLKWVPKFIFSVSSAAHLLRFGLPVTAHYLLNYFSTRSDILLIGKLLGQQVLGYYSVALSLSRIPVDKGVLIIQGVVFPLFSQLQDNPTVFIKYYYMVIYLISIFCFPVFFGMVAVTEEIIVLILSPKWMPILVPLKFFCILGVLQSYTGLFLVILKARGCTTAVFRYSLLSAVVLPIGFFVFSKYGLIGIALCWLILFPPLFGYLFYNVLSEIGASFNKSLKQISPAFFGSSLMFLVVLILKITVFKDTISYGSLSIYIITGAIVYVGYFYLFSRRTFQDMRRIYNNLKA